MGGSTTYSLNNGILNVSGNWFIAYQVNVKENTDYYISADREIISGTASGNISIYNSAVTTVINNGGRSNFTFNSGNNTVISVVLYAGTGSAGEVNFSNIMLNIGTTEKPYSPYVSNPIELNNKDTLFHAVTGDTIYENLSAETKASLTYGNWYIEKNIGKVVLNGTENWIRHTGIASWFYYDGIANGYFNNAINNFALTNYFTQKQYSNVANLTNGEFAYGSSDNGATHRLVFKDTDFTATADFKNWLTTHNVTLYYVLANPTYEIITNTNLIEQLNNIQNIELIENLCYVDWAGEEKPKMKLFCYLDKDKIIEEITG